MAPEVVTASSAVNQATLLVTALVLVVTTTELALLDPETVSSVVNPGIWQEIAVPKLGTLGGYYESIGYLNDVLVSKGEPYLDIREYLQ